MGYYEDHYSKDCHSNKKYKKYREIDTSNSVINVNVNDCNKEKKHKKACECGAIVNNNTFTIRICSNCNDKNNVLIYRDTNFRATSISPPDCFTDRNGTHLTASGTAIFTQNGVTREGVFNVIITEFPQGDFDRVLLTYATFNPTSIGDFTFVNAGVRDGDLSITKCYSCNCSNNSFRLPSPSFNTLNTNFSGKSVFVDSNGKVEINERTEF